MPFNRLNHSILGEIRPRFVLQIDCEPEIAIEHVKESLKKDPTVTTLKANYTKNYVFLNIPYNIQHYWSPEMTVRIEKGEFSGITTVNCLIGPRQSVWAMFALIYAFISIGTLFGGMFGFVKYQTSGTTAFLWFFPIGLFLISTVFFAAKVGQRKGRDQMLHLVSFLYHSLNELTEVKRVEKK
ncbi:MAG: hypothetical protein ACK5B9_06810 [Flavobacteriia bacterium]|jgi:hypothetical protein